MGSLKAKRGISKSMELIFRVFPMPLVIREGFLHDRTRNPLEIVGT